MNETVRRELVQRLIHDEYQIVYRFAYRLSGSHADAEDLTQQTFLMVYRKVEQLNSVQRARSWLFTIVRNNFLKSRQQQKHWELPGGEDAWIAENSSSWPDEFDEKQLQLALSEMPETFRSPVLLYYFEELSYKEIAEILEVPMGTVMSRLARGKQFLRSRMMTHQDEEIQNDPVVSPPKPVTLNTD